MSDSLSEVRATLQPRSTRNFNDMQNAAPRQVRPIIRLGGVSSRLRHCKIARRCQQRVISLGRPVIDVGPRIFMRKHELRTRDARYVPVESLKLLKS